MPPAFGKAFPAVVLAVVAKSKADLTALGVAAVVALVLEVESVN